MAVIHAVDLEGRSERDELRLRRRLARPARFLDHTHPDNGRQDGNDEYDDEDFEEGESKKEDFEEKGEGEEEI